MPPHPVVFDSSSIKLSCRLSFLKRRNSVPSSSSLSRLLCCRTCAKRCAGSSGDTRPAAATLASPAVPPRCGRALSLAGGRPRVLIWTLRAQLGPRGGSVATRRWEQKGNCSVPVLEGEGGMGGLFPNASPWWICGPARLSAPPLLHPLRHRWTSPLWAGSAAGLGHAWLHSLPSVSRVTPLSTGDPPPLSENSIHSSAETGRPGSWFWSWLRT